MVDCEACRKRREAIAARLREFAVRVQNPFATRTQTLTVAKKEKQEENVAKKD